MSDYKVNLENVFAGPLDLLLYLVRKDEVDIYNISISKITNQYLEYIDMLRGLDLDLAGDFLVMAATLMEIKSAMLLPNSNVDDVDDQEACDPRHTLIKQLLEYKKFKDAASLLEVKQQQREEIFTRGDSVTRSLKQNNEPELDMEQVSIWNLLETFDDLMRQTGRYQDYSTIKDDTPIDVYQVQILERLQVDGPMTFEHIFQNANNKLAMIGLFLGLLELVRNKLVWAQQPDSGIVYLRALTDEPANEAVQNAILATEQQHLALVAQRMGDQDDSSKESEPLDKSENKKDNSVTNPIKEEAIKAKEELDSFLEDELGGNT